MSSFIVIWGSLRSKAEDQSTKEAMIAEESKTNPKPFWAHVRGKLKTKEGVAPLLQNPKDKSSMKFTDEEKSNILLQQFTSVFTHEPAGESPTMPSRTAAIMETIIVTAEMILKEITELNLIGQCVEGGYHTYRGKLGLMSFFGR